MCEQTFAWLTKYGKTTRHKNQHRFFFYISKYIYATLKKENRRSSKQCKEIGTSASLAGHCYNADDRIIKCSNKFENGMRWRCLYSTIRACYSLSWVYSYKNKHSEMYKMGAKSFVLCSYENKPYTPLLFCARFKQGERVFLLSVSRCGISRRQAHVRGVTRWETVILNYECTIRGVFPVWHNRRDYCLAA